MNRYYLSTKMNYFKNENKTIDLSKITDFPIVNNRLIVKSFTKRDLRVNKELVLKKCILKI